MHNGTLRLFCALLILLAGLTGCVPISDPQPTQNATPPTASDPAPADTAEVPSIFESATSPTVDREALEKESEALADYEGAAPVKASVEAPGILVQTGGGATIDYSNYDQGYVMVRFAEQTDLRLKVQIKGPATTYTYNLTAGAWTAFPLSDQNGSYQIIVYQNVTGSKYAAVLSVGIEVSLRNEFAPFLHANQYVNYDDAPKATALAASLTAGMDTPLEKVSAVYNYVVGNLTYDHALAASVKSGYLPDLDRALEKGSGICFDYAALMTGMLRSLQIPTKLVVGYAGEVYHAWISVWSEETGWVEGVIFFDGTAWKRMDPTFAANGDAGILDYINDPSNYTSKYFY